MSLNKIGLQVCSRKIFLASLSPENSGSNVCPSINMAASVSPKKRGKYVPNKKEAASMSLGKKPAFKVCPSKPRHAKYAPRKIFLASLSLKNAVSQVCPSIKYGFKYVPGKKPVFNVCPPEKKEDKGCLPSPPLTKKGYMYVPEKIIYPKSVPQ